MNKRINIAIDGPAGAGKSTVAKAVAAALGITYLDTGAMYRAIALKALKNGVDPNDAPAVEAFLPQTRVDVAYENGSQRVLLDGEDVTGAIRGHAVSKAASDVSRHPSVRIKLVELQREIAASSDVVVDGRDIGSYVLPNAEYKYYLTASPEVRARRRWRELTAGGVKADFEEILRDVNQRDYNDMHRDFAPLVRAADAVEIDSTEMSAEEVVQFIVERCQ